MPRRAWPIDWNRAAFSLGTVHSPLARYPSSSGTMGRLFVVVTACAAVASAGGAASLSAARGDCKVECKQVHRQLSPDTCRKLGRTVAREARAAASNACLAAFNRGLQDECEETCLAKFGGRGGGHPGPALDRVYDAMGRPCTDRENWDACRRGYEDAVAKTREFFDFDDHKKAPPRGSRPRSRRTSNARRRSASRTSSRSPTAARPCPSCSARATRSSRSSTPGAATTSRTTPRARARSGSSPRPPRSATAGPCNTRRHFLPRGSSRPCRLDASTRNEWLAGGLEATDT